MARNFDGKWQRLEAFHAHQYSLVDGLQESQVCLCLAWQRKGLRKGTPGNGYITMHAERWTKDAVGVEKRRLTWIDQPVPPMGTPGHE